MIQDHYEIVCDCMLTADAQVFDLVDQIDDVELLQPPSLSSRTCFSTQRQKSRSWSGFFGLDGFRGACHVMRPLVPSNRV
jgi:hypothetical protein